MASATQNDRESDATTPGGARSPRLRVIGKTPEGFSVFAPAVPPTLADPREIRRWIQARRAKSGKAPARAR